MERRTLVYEVTMTRVDIILNLATVYISSAAVLICSNTAKVLGWRGGSIGLLVLGLAMIGVGIYYTRALIKEWNLIKEKENESTDSTPR